MNEVIKIMKPLEDLNLTINGICKEVKDDITERRKVVDTWYFLYFLVL